MAKEDSGGGGGFGSFMRGVIVGGLAGAVYALLTTPRTGEETREMLREKGMEYRDKAMNAVEDTRSRAEQVISEARTRAESTISRAKDEAQGFKRDTEHYTQEQAGRLEDITRTATDKPDTTLGM